MGWNPFALRQAQESTDTTIDWSHIDGREGVLNVITHIQERLQRENLVVTLHSGNPERMGKVRQSVVLSKDANTSEIRAVLEKLSDHFFTGASMRDAVGNWSDYYSVEPQGPRVVSFSETKEPEMQTLKIIKLTGVENLRASLIELLNGIKASDMPGWQYTLMASLENFDDADGLSKQTSVALSVFQADFTEGLPEEDREKKASEIFDKISEALMQHSTSISNATPLVITLQSKTISDTAE